MDHVIVYTDGASRGNPGPAGAGWLLVDGDGQVCEEGVLPLGRTTNNVAEYRAVIAALERARELGATRVTLRSDSELLIQQLSGAYRVRAERLQPLYRRVQELACAFERVTYEHVPREQNRRADRLANQAAGANEAADFSSGPGESGTVAGGNSGAAGRAPAIDGAVRGSSVNAHADTAGERAEPADPPAAPAPSDDLPAVVLRVRYGETDQMGLVYYANYLDWFTEGRTELMRRHGIPYRDLEAQGIFLPVGEVECRYRRPGRYDDRVAVYASISKLTPARLEFTYRIVRIESAHGEETGLLAEGRTVHGFVDAAGRPFNLQKRLPDLWERIRRAAGGGA
ncbi:MAG TPA: YbgC/FadM family acyl-CoA thioesterase [Trebonia sp.]